MFGVSSVVTIAKYGFIGLVVTGAGFLIANITVMKHYKSEMTDSLVYKLQMSVSEEGALSMLDKGFGKCLTKPNGIFCALATGLRLDLLHPKGQVDSGHVRDAVVQALNVSSSTRHRRRQLFHSLLEDFFGICALYNVRPILLEPSMLFCMVTPSNKLDLLTKGFNPGRFRGSSNVVTVGVSAEDSKALDQAHNSTTALIAGFHVSRVRRWLKLSELDPSKHADDFYTIHSLFTGQGVTIHVVVFFEVNRFLWHAGLHTEDTGVKDLLVVNESAYDNFTSEELKLENLPEFRFYIPSDPVRFLLQMRTSELRKCRRHSSEGAVTRSVWKHDTLTEEQLAIRAVVGIQELKTVFQPRHALFWLWTETLTGWYEDCDVFARTSELNFAVALSVLNSFNFSDILTDNEYLKLTHHHPLNNNDFKFALDCHGLRINIFAAYVDENLVQDYNQDEKHPGRLDLSKFELCSAVLFGQRVHVPCDPPVMVQVEEQGA